MTRRSNATWAAALAAGLLTLSGCGGSGTAAATKTEGSVLLGQQLENMVSQVDTMGVVEWHGQLLTKNPDKGGKQIFDLGGRYSPSTGDSELSMDSAINGKVQQVDYLVVADRTYFNSEDWGPDASDCWADITDDPARSWGLPTELDPSWALTNARPTALDGDDVAAAIPFKQVLDGLPRGLIPVIPTVPYDTEAEAFIAPHGFLIEVGVDVVSMWNTLPKQQRAGINTRGAGWWAMTMKQAQDESSIAPPQHVFDPAITPPSQCKRA